MIKTDAICSPSYWMLPDCTQQVRIYEELKWMTRTQCITDNIISDTGGDQQRRECSVWVLLYDCADGCFSSLVWMTWTDKQILIVWEQSKYFMYVLCILWCANTLIHWFSGLIKHLSMARIYSTLILLIWHTITVFLVIPEVVSN